MNTLQHFTMMAALSGDGLVNALIYVVALGLICWLLFWFLDYVKVPEPFNKVGKVLLALVAVVLLIRLIIRVTGVSL